MGTPGLFIIAVVGLLAGALGRALLLGRPSRFAGMTAGMAGAMAGPALAEAFGYPATALWQIALVAVAGAIVLLGAARLLDRR